MSDYLLVPTNVQGFVVGRPGEQVYDLAPVPRTEDDVAKWYVQSKYGFSFENKKLPSLKPGIHLHWALPAALMHSRHQGAGEPEQPCIPNRWLVLRMWHADGKKDISSKAWVVESDFVSKDDEFGGTPFLVMGAGSPGGPNEVHCRYVGRTVALESWPKTVTY
jgi:hypothetical protein